MTTPTASTKTRSERYAGRFAAETPNPPAVISAAVGAHTISRLLDCSGLKRARMGPGYFMTRHEAFHNVRDEVLGHATMTMFQYGSGVRLGQTAEL
jgi:hypothetical protein